MVGVTVRALGLSLALLCGATAVVAQPSPPDRPMVAFLAPLSGEHQALGERAWQALVLASEGAGPQFERFDTAADSPESAYAAAVAAGAVAVIGPIGEEESRAVAAVADAIPVFLLTGVDGVERADERVMRLRTSPADQAEALAGAVLADADGPRSFAVLAPLDPYGDEAAASFVRSVAAFGGTVSRVARYEAGEPDVADAAAVLVGERSVRLDVPSDPWRTPPRTRESTRGGDRSVPDAVFIPDYARQVSAILPHLAFHGWLRETGSGSVGLLGLSGWAGEGLSPAGDLAAMARLVQVFDPEDVSFAADGFALEWEVRFGDRATAFEAQVFDAARFVLQVVSESPSLSAASLADTALHRVPFGGVCGAMWLDADGGIVRELGLWEVDGGGFLYPLGTIRPPPP